MSNSKMTQRDFFNEIIALAKGASRADIVTFAEGRIAALDKKAATKKPTKTQEANEGIKTEILAVLTGADPMTVTDMMKASAVLGECSNQKLSALLKQMKDAGAVVKSTEGKRSLFTVKAAD